MKMLLIWKMVTSQFLFFRVKNVEDELLKARNDCKRFQANFEGLIHEMVAEVDALMEIAASGSKEKQKVNMSTIAFVSLYCTYPVNTFLCMQYKESYLREFVWNVIIKYVYGAKYKGIIKFFCSLTSRIYATLLFEVIILFKRCAFLSEDNVVFKQIKKNY